MSMWHYENFYSVFFFPCGYKFQSQNEALFSGMWRYEVCRKREEGSRYPGEAEIRDRQQS